MREKRAKGKEIFNVTCRVCGRVGKIFVEPTNPRDVYCETCFAEAWEAHLEKHPEERAMHEKAEREAAALTETADS
jgi:CxxC-x17-CxxC domain-containing protein